MAHNLNFNKGLKRHAMVSVREIPWHGLGKVVQHALTSRECIVEAGLDFRVGLSTVLAEIDGNYRLMDDYKVTYRQDINHPFAVVGSKYEVVQNEDAFAFFDSIVGEGQAIFETAGALHDGRTVFITAKLPSNIVVQGVDTINCYLLFTLSHDGSSAIRIMFTPIRVVCNNTLDAALHRGYNKVSFKHTRSVHDNIAKAKEIMGISHNIIQESSELYERMSEHKIEYGEVISFIYNLVLNKAEVALVKEKKTTVDRVSEISTRKKNIIGDIIDYTNSGPGQDLATTAGTLFGVYNGVTGYIQNMKKFKTPNHKMDSMFFGTARSLSTGALSLATDVLEGQVKLI